MFFLHFGEGPLCPPSYPLGINQACYQHTVHKLAFVMICGTSLPIACVSCTINAE